jgi:indolepyruvate ferredoxin oxidoreductase beta subunit
MMGSFKYRLPSDPFNIIIAGVGGQGNVLMSKIVGSVLIQKNMQVTVGEDFGMSQRGGSVCSHLRVSAISTWSPMVPPNTADIIIGLEPIEAFRLLCLHGNPNVKVLCNSRPVHPLSVISGETNYPEMDDIIQWMEELSSKCWFLDATAEAMELGRAVYANIIMVGALAGIGVLPIDRDEFEKVITGMMTPDKVDVNLQAFDRGLLMVA